jgi:type IV pilus assembly protein PilE
MTDSRQTGVTLIELMVVLAIMGILSAIAYPGYQNYVRKGQRAEAKSLLLQNAQFLERNLTEANRYDKDSTNASVVLPHQSSPQAGDAVYSISVVATATSYALTAAPVSGGIADGDECGSLTLNQLGQRGVSGATLDAASCWNR